MWFMWEEGIKPSDTHHQFPAVFRDKAPACSTVFNCVWSFNSGKETTQVACMSGITTPIKNGSVKPSKSSQEDGSHV
jgi:hypothetical protein